MEKLKDWLNTEVEIVEKDTDERYSGDILELIWRLNGMLIWICSFIEKIQSGATIKSVAGLIYETVLPYDDVYIIHTGDVSTEDVSPEAHNKGDVVGTRVDTYEMGKKLDAHKKHKKGDVVGTRVDTYELGRKLGMYVHTMTAYKNTNQSGFYYSNLKTLCEKIMQLDTDQLNALHEMLCLRNDKGQSLYNWSAWSELVEQNRAKKGHVLFYKLPKRKPEDSVGGPWVKISSSGGKRTKRHKRSGHKKRSSKRSSKRSGHKSRRH